MAAKKGFVIKVQEIYKWKKLPVAKVLFFDCQRFAERFSNVSTAEKTMFAFLSVALFSRTDRLVSSQQVSNYDYKVYHIFHNIFSFW